MAKAGGMGIGMSKGSSSNHKRTSQGRGTVKFSSMNKSKKSSYKAYRGQG
jgi:hypothetical protein